MKILKFRSLTSFAILLAALGCLPEIGTAQYFQSMPSHSARQVMKASGRDSVIVNRLTPFDLPKTNDTIKFVYHEPMPDSIMPRSAIVIGTIALQFENEEDVVPALEKFARNAGADWIVSFQEPKAALTGDHWKVYRSTALLLHVLDPNFINQSDISYSYYEQSNLNNYAAVNQWYDAYGRRLGFKTDQPADTPMSDQDRENPDRQSTK